MKSEGVNGEINRISFLNTLIQGSIRTIKRGPDALDKLYDGYKKLIENQIKSTPKKEEECKRLLDILEKSYIMFSDPEVVDIIIKNNITHKQFISRYGERILGDNKRKYDMSDKFNPDLIAYQDEEKQERKVKYIPKQGLEYIYLDEIGNKVSIQEIGRLYFEEWNGLNSSISKYRIIKQLGNGDYQEDEVFSNIIIMLMENLEYREAVLGELLSKNNIELSKTGGYIGEIVSVSKSTNEFKVGSEKTIASDYFYRVNSQYALTYRSEEIAAIMLQNISQKIDNDRNTGKITKITDRKKLIPRDNSSNTPSIRGEKTGEETR